MKGKCEICNCADSKYRCPSCKILYCSLGCYKSHKVSQCGVKQIKPGNVEEKSLKQEYFTTEKAKNQLLQDDDEDLISPEKLSLLDDSKALADQLQNSHLRNLLLSIDSADNPGQELEKAMQLPLFTDFVDECMNVINAKDEE